MGPDNFWGSGMWMFPIVMMIICLFAFGVFRRRGCKPPWSQDPGGHHSESPDSETPLEILKKRYAKGEVTKKEFDQMKKDL